MNALDVSAKVVRHLKNMIMIAYSKHELWLDS